MSDKPKVDNSEKNYNLTKNRQVQLICNACTHLGV